MPNTKAATDTSLTLCAFRAAPLAELSGGKTSNTTLPERLVVAPWGTHDVRGRGKVTVNEQTLSSFTAAQKALKLDGAVAIDFDHNTVPGTESFKSSPEPRKVAAFGVPVVERNVGIVLTALRWTPEGEAALKGGHYQDISPAVFRRADGTVYALHSAGVCRHGEIDGLTIEAAKAHASLAPFFAALSAELQTESNANAITPSMKDALIKLLAACGITLAADADEATTTKALEDAAPLVTAAMKKEEPAAMGADAELVKRVDALSAKMDTVEKEGDRIKRERLIQQAQAEGKVIPLSAETLAVTPLNILENIVATAKAGEVPLDRKTPTGEPLGDKVDTFSAEDKAAFARMGISEEEARKGLGLPEKKTA